MTALSFSIIFGIIMSVSILMMILSLKPIPTVKAGKVDKFSFRYDFTGSKKSDKVICGDRVYSTEGLTVLSVKGNSMSAYGIRTNSFVYVEPMTDSKMKNSITTHPVVVFTIVDGSKIQSQYKLRKFVRYVDNIANADWATVYDEVGDNFTMRLSKEDFMEMMKMKVEKTTDDKSLRFVISETLNEQSSQYEYSLHTVDTIFGKVRYVTQQHIGK